MSRRFFLGGIFSVGLAAHAAFDEKPFSARAAALGESLVAVSDGVDNVASNPAGLLFAQAPVLSMGYGRLFGSADLPYSVVSGAWRSSARTAGGAALGDFGSSLYREREAVVCFARAIVLDRAGVGVAVKYQEASVQRYGRSSAVRLDLGFFGKPLSRVGLGFALRNVAGTSVDAANLTPPQLFSAGASASFGATTTAVSLVREDRGRSSWRIGEEILPHRALSLRVGFESSPQIFSAGFGLRQVRWGIDYAFVSHPTLPEQHRVTLTWRGDR